MSRRKDRKKRKLKNTHFWRSYRLYLASLRLVSKIIDEHPDIERVVYFRTKRMLEQFSKSYRKDLETLKRTKLLKEFTKDYVKQNGKKAVPKKLKREKSIVELSDVVTSESEESTESSDSSDSEKEEEEVSDDSDDKKKQFAQMKRNCPHTRHYIGEISIKNDVIEKKCEECGEDENWLWYKNGHMAKHAKETKHQIAVSLSDLSFWCFRCNSYIQHDRLLPIFVTLKHYKFSEKKKKPEEVEGEKEEEEEKKKPEDDPKPDTPTSTYKRKADFDSLKVTGKSKVVRSPMASGISNDVFNPDNYMKKVVVSEYLIQQFLKLAERHIAYKIEFCGMLCGREIRSGENYGGEGSDISPPYYLITDCCIPDQAGHSDFVQCYDEHIVHKYQMKNGLIAVGWIHTHPTQSAFLSSMDIYTQFSFQRMMPEFIAVVCAPRCRPNLGIFRIASKKMEKVRELTVSNKKFGKSLIKLRERIYEKCKHCHVDKESKLGTVVDLRKNKAIRVLRY